MADIPSRKSTIIAERFTVEENTFKRAVTDNPRDKIEVEIGDSKQPDFKPQAKISRWSNEVNFSLRAEEHPEAVVRTEGKLIKYVTPDYEVHQYELDPGEIGESGGLEFEWVLPAKPASNVLNATIQTKSLDFFYQPALTQEEIDEGAERPENVVGSYAVYHKTKGGMNRADGMEYKTGKAFHIYRPKVTDADKNETWAELNIDEASGVLSVTVPQDFLEKAVYPVIVDPTFGYTSLGASATGNIATLTNDVSAMRGRGFSSPVSGSLDSITAGLVASVNQTGIDIYMAVFQEDSGGTGTHGLVAGAESSGVPISTTAAFESIDLNGEAITNDNYILAVLGNGEDVITSGSVYVAHDTGSSGNDYFESSSGAGGYSARKSENPWTENASSSTSVRSIYATYESGATNVSVDADVVTLTGSLPAPTVTGIQNVSTTADVVTSTLSAQAPTITGKANVIVDVITLNGSLLDPTITTDSAVNVSVDADVVLANLSVQAPTVTGDANITADLVSTTVSIPDPTISAARYVSVVPDAMVLAASLPDPTVTTTRNVSTTADVITLTGSLPDQTITGDAIISTDVVTLTGTIPDTTITAVMNVSTLADVITLTGLLPTPTISLDTGYLGNASWGIDINTFGLVMNKRSRVPNWTTAGRPNGRPGLIGWNRETNRLEMYDTDSDSWYYVSGTQI